MHQVGLRETRLPRVFDFSHKKIIVKMESDLKATLQRLLSKNDTSIVLTDISGRSEVTKTFLRVQRHTCKVSSKQPAISSFMKHKVPVTVKSRFTDVMARMCSQDLRPFATVEGRGFIEVAKELINIGAKYGSSIEIEDVLPSARTVSRHVEDEYERVKKQLMEELQQVGLATLLFLCLMLVSIFLAIFGAYFYGIVN